MNWAVVYDRADEDVHVIPVDDLIDHTLNDACADGSDGWVWVHHSLDGREQHEGEAS